MNEYDIEEALRHTAMFEVPVLRQGAEILSRLKDWTNSNSDGWPYWQVPGRAANRLMEALEQARRDRYEHDISEAELKALLRPIKSFLTKRGVDHALILEKPPVPDPYGTVTTEEGAKFFPWTDGRCVGYKVVAPGRPDTFIYFNPSGGTDTGRIGDTDVFIYRGSEGDPALDDSECYVNIWEAQDA